MKRLVKDETLCIECHRCEETCAQAYFKSGDIGKARLNVDRKKTGEVDITICTQCGKCMEVCQVLAISRNPKNGVVYVDKNKCVGCFMCVAACPFDAMMRHEEEMEPFKCIACGLCTKECPTQAITLQEVEE